MDITFFLAGADVVELDSGGAVVVGLDGCRAAVAPSKPSRSMGSSRSTGMVSGSQPSGIWCYLAAVGIPGSLWPLIAGDCDEPGLLAWGWPPGGHSLVWAQFH